MFINKTTVVWLLQESERVSSDRLFRVRNKQPYTNENLKISIPQSTVEQPSYCEEVSVGDICVFEKDGNWIAGKILQFSHHNEKTKGAQQYRGSVAKVSCTTSLGILCSWYSKSEDSHVLFCAQTPTSVTDTQQLASSSSTQVINDAHCFIPLSSYVCTLPHGCFENIDYNLSKSIKSVDCHNDAAVALTAANKL